MLILGKIKEEKMPTVKIITSELVSSKYHEDRVNAYLDELHVDGYFNAKIEHFITHGYGDTRKIGENATLVTIITVGK